MPEKLNGKLNLYEASCYKIRVIFMDKFKKNPLFELCEKVNRLYISSTQIVNHIFFTKPYNEQWRIQDFRKGGARLFFFFFFFFFFAFQQEGGVGR